jgi:DNA polymerase III alpha subunit (gram-positive type)
MNDEMRYPHREDENKILWDLCRQKFTEMYEKKVCIQFYKQLEKELKCIASLHMSGIFLVFKELFEKLGWKEYEHVFRGTLGSSLVAYLCGLTDTDPIRGDIPLYPEICFGYEFNKEPYFDLLVPTGRIEEMREALTRINDGLDIVPAKIEHGQNHPSNHPSVKYLIPKYFKYDVESYFKLSISESKQIDFLVRLAELTGINPCEADMKDSNILGMYKNTEVPDLVYSGDNRITALGLPEVRTPEMVNMLYKMRNQVESFADLVRVYGLLHSTIEWDGNEEDFTAELDAALTCREDISEYCVHFGISPYNSFRAEDFVQREQKFPINLYGSDNFDLVRRIVPKWFIDTCWGIRCLLPRAHCYHMMLLSWRCAFFRYYHPKEFYQAYFEVMADGDVSRSLSEGQEAYCNLKNVFTEGVLSYQEEQLIDFAVADEMFNRGCSIKHCQKGYRVCWGRHLLRGMRDAAKENKLIEFRQKWSKSNLDIYGMDVFRGKQMAQEQLVMLIKHLELNGFSATLHMDDSEEGYETLLEGIKSRIHFGNVTVNK